jgi:hypothetical protein
MAIFYPFGRSAELLQGVPSTLNKGALSGTARCNSVLNTATIGSIGAVYGTISVIPAEGSFGGQQREWGPTGLNCGFIVRQGVYNLTPPHNFMCVYPNTPRIVHKLYLLNTRASWAFRGNFDLIKSMAFSLDFCGNFDLIWPFRLISENFDLIISMEL